MSDFNNTTIGGAKVEIDDARNGTWVDIGITEGDIEFGRQTEIKQLLDGIPLNVVGQALIKEIYSIKVPAVEVTPENISRAALNIPITTIAGGTITVSDGANQERIFAASPDNPFERIILDGGAIVASSVTVKNQAENVTYVEGTHYNVDYTKGLIYRIPVASGGIASGATVRVNYQWVQLASKRLYLGKNLPITYRAIRLTHVSPINGATYLIVLNKVQGSGALTLNVKKEDFWKLEMNFTALPDATQTLGPIGYIDYAPAA